MTIALTESALVWRFGASGGGNVDGLYRWRSDQYAAVDYALAPLVVVVIERMKASGYDLLPDHRFDICRIVTTTQPRGEASTETTAFDTYGRFHFARGNGRLTVQASGKRYAQDPNVALQYSRLSDRCLFESLEPQVTSGRGRHAFDLDAVKQTHADTPPSP